MRTLGIAACVALTAIGCAAFRPRVSLDATTVTVNPEPGHSVESGTIEFPPPPPTPFPLRLDLLRFDRRQYRRMDRVKYDIRVQNVSARRLPFPWSPVPIARSDRPRTGYRHALFELVIARANQPDWAVDTFVLYGSPTIAGSLRELLPGEIVTVRLAATLSGGGFQDVRNPVLYPATETGVKVGMTVYAPDDARFRSFHEEFSHETLTFTIVRDPRRPRR